MPQDLLNLCEHYMCLLMLSDYGSEPAYFILKDKVLLLLKQCCSKYGLPSAKLIIQLHYAAEQFIMDKDLIFNLDGLN